MLGIGPRVSIVLRGLLYLFLLTAVAPWIGYPTVFRAASNVVFHSIGPSRLARFDRFDDPSGMLDTKVSVGTDARGPVEYLSSVGINSLREGFTPAAVIVALLLATPAPWPLRLRWIGVGFALTQIFVAARVAVLLLYGFSRVGFADRRLLDCGALGSRMLRLADQVLSADLQSSYVVPALIWLLLTARAGITVRLPPFSPGHAGPAARSRRFSSSRAPRGAPCAPAQRASRATAVLPGGRNRPARREIRPRCPSSSNTERVHGGRAETSPHE
jgi:hypothetical protein